MLLDLSTIFFYLVFIFLWFKDNLSPLKKIQISCLLPLVVFMICLGLRLWISLRSGRLKIKPKIKNNRTLFAVIILILAAVVLRLPYIINHNGLMSSDDAVPALMGKHIAEGNLPPVYYYGQLYMGSVSEHFYAFFFFIFGYSILILKLSTLLFFLGFLSLQFIFLKNVFSFNFAAIVSIFYCLPFGFIYRVSFDNTGAYGLVLLLGTAVLYTSYLIFFRDRKDLVFLLGLLFGISFWAHQISICFILTSLVLFVTKFKFQIKKYIQLAAFSAIGCFPVFILEVYWKFPLIRFLTSGSGQFSPGEKIGRFIRLSASLLSLNASFLKYILIFLVVLGSVLPIVMIIKSKKFHPAVIFSLFFLVFFFIYIFSGFSSIEVIRYLFPLYFCLPVLLFLPFKYLKQKIRYVGMIGLMVIVVGMFNFPQILSNIAGVKESHQRLNTVIELMRKTDVEYWRGYYWTSYLITAVSGEELIVDSLTVNRYFPYRLYYSNWSEKENFIFLRRDGREGQFAEQLINLLSSMGIGFDKKEDPEYLLVYNIPVPVYPQILSDSVPKRIPEILLTKITESGGHLILSFTIKGNQDLSGFRIRAGVEGYCEILRRIPSEAGKIQMKIPYSSIAPLTIFYTIEYKGMSSKEAINRVEYIPLHRPQRKKIVQLEGFGPNIKQEELVGTACGKEIKFELNRLKKELYILRLSLFSPFEFSHPYWYGDFTQKITVSINNQVSFQGELADGNNLIDIELDGTQLKKNGSILTCQFKYHYPFNFIPYWQTSVLLKSIDYVK